MISSIRIEGYRGFERFEMGSLERINLLVGTNNSGKTSILEALHLLSSLGDPTAVWQLIWRRGERLPSIDRSPRGPEPELDISHLFTGHEMHPGSKFVLSARNQSPERSVTFEVEEQTAKERREASLADVEGSVGSSRLVLRIKGTPPPPVSALPLTRYGGIRSDFLELPRGRISGAGRRRFSEIGPSQFITTESSKATSLFRSGTKSLSLRTNHLFWGRSNSWMVILSALRRKRPRPTTTMAGVAVDLSSR